jgi:glycosyltransferase involved in cell wall biosynthesis
MIISSYYPIIGGAEKVTENIAKKLIAKNHNAEILTRYQLPNVKREEINEGVRIHRLGIVGTTKFSALFFFLHSILLLIVNNRNFNVLHVHSPDTPMFIGFFGKLFLNKKLILTIHGENRIRFFLKNWSNRLRLNLMRRLVDDFICISPVIKEQLIELGVEEGKLHSIPNGVDESLFSPPAPSEKLSLRKKFGFEENEIIVIFIGRIEAVKRVDLLLEAWKENHILHDHTLLIVGSGSKKKELISFVEKHNLNVRFESFTDEVASYLKLSDIFVLPSGIRESKTYEGLSVALIEAMASGMAILASDCPGNKILIEDECTGLLFPVGNSLILGQQLIRLTSNVKLRSIYGINARKKVVEKYSIHRIVDEIIKVYLKSG